MKNTIYILSKLQNYPYISLKLQNHLSLHLRHLSIPTLTQRNLPVVHLQPKSITQKQSIQIGNSKQIRTQNQLPNSETQNLNRKIKTIYQNPVSDPTTIVIGKLEKEKLRLRNDHHRQIGKKNLRNHHLWPLILFEIGLAKGKSETPCHRLPQIP